jgi:hypothetical protein
METANSTESQSLGKSPAGGMRRWLSEAARFWERWRLIYNLVLAAFVVGWIVRTWPHFRHAMTLENLGRLMILALLANVCYCAAYLMDILIQQSGAESSWRLQRTALWVVGMLLAILLENYWIADEIYDFVQ